MLKEYRKKTTIKAEQFDGSDEMCERYGIKQHIEQLGPLTDLYFLIPTKEGNMKLNAGDWIATGIDGEHWAISQEIFEKTYERVDQE